MTEGSHYGESFKSQKTHAILCIYCFLLGILDMSSQLLSQLPATFPSDTLESNPLKLCMLVFCRSNQEINKGLER